MIPPHPTPHPGKFFATFKFKNKSEHLFRAGANFSAISGNDPNARRWDKGGYLAMMQLIEAGADEAKYLAKMKSTEYFDDAPPAEKISSMKEYLQDVSWQHHAFLVQSKLIQSITVCHTPSLRASSRCHLRHSIHHCSPQRSRAPQTSILPPLIPGLRLYTLFATPCTITRRSIRSKKHQVVFNCVGNAARTLQGVQDERSYPTRGQVVLVKAPHVQENIIRHGRDYVTYVIPRPNSDGSVILGGYMQKGNAYVSQPFPAILFSGQNNSQSI